MRIGTCIENDQNESVCITGPRATMRYQEKRLAYNLMNTKYNSYISEYKTKIKQNTLSTTVDNQKGSNIGPPPKPNLLLMN